MASTPYPLPRETRESALLVGNGTVGPYGPTAFKVFDTDDVQVWTKPEGAHRYALTAANVLKTAGQDLDTVSVTFAHALPATTKFLITSRRRHERSVAVSKGGTLSTQELEKELSKQGSILQELRRDINRGGATVAGTFGQTLVIGPDGYVVPGADQSEILNAQTYATNAGISADRAQTAEKSARDAQLAAESAAGANLSNSDSRAAAAVTNIPGPVNYVRTAGLNIPGDDGGALYKRTATEPSHNGKFQSADGAWWEITERRPQLPMFGYPAMTVETITARMAAGAAVNIICYGDSTTDGNGTTGWTANPTVGGEAAGVDDHAATAPNAWPARLEAILRDMFRNNNIRCFNAGYTGQRMDNGWAYRNYNQAVIDNPAYGAGDLVFIAFGLNDIVDAGSQADDHIEQSRRVILKVMSFGAVPVLLTCDAFWRNEASTRDAIEAQRTINQAKIGLAKELGIECFDVNMAMQRWFGTNNEGYDWHNIQPDALHVGDIGHRFKAGFIASRLFRDTICVNEGDRVRTVAGDTRFRSAIGQDRVYTGEGAAQRGGMNVIFPIASYAAETEAGSAWVWNEAEDAVLIYRALDNNGIVGFDDGPRMVLTNQQSGSAYHNQILSNSGGTLNDFHRTADRPVFINYLPFGLSKVSLISPKTTNTSWFHGYLEVNTKTRNISRRLSRRSGSVHSVNGLKETGELFWATSATGIAVSPSSEAKDLSNVIEYGRPGALCTLLIECKISPGMGFTILSGKGWNGTEGALDNTSKLLFRGGAGNLSLYDLRRTPGGVWTFGTSDEITVWGAEEYRKLRIDFVRDAGTGQKRMNFYSGWGTGSLLTTVVDAAGRFFPTSGYFGDLFSNSASHGAGDKTVHIKSAQIVNFS